MCGRRKDVGEMIQRGDGRRLGRRALLGTNRGGTGNVVGKMTKTRRIQVAEMSSVDFGIGRPATS